MTAATAMRGRLGYSPTRIYLWLPDAIFFQEIWLFDIFCLFSKQ